MERLVYCTVLYALRPIRRGPPWMQSRIMHLFITSSVQHTVPEQCCTLYNILWGSWKRALQLEQVMDGELVTNMSRACLCTIKHNSRTQSKLCSAMYHFVNPSYYSNINDEVATDCNFFLVDHNIPQLMGEIPYSISITLPHFAVVNLKITREQETIHTSTEQ
jgi:hypothetical protein